MCPEPEPELPTEAPQERLPRSSSPESDEATDPSDPLFAKDPDDFREWKLKRPIESEPK